MNWYAYVKWHFDLHTAKPLAASTSLRGFLYGSTFAAYVHVYVVRLVGLDDCMRSKRYYEREVNDKYDNLENNSKSVKSSVL